jgi:putative hydrolase of the HAD superfamily
MRPIRAVFFDAGNTLFTERTSRGGVYSDVLRRHGLATDPAAIGGLIAATHDELPRVIEGHYRYTEGWFRTFIVEVAARAGFFGDYDALERDLFAAFRDPATFRVFDEVRPVLKRLRGAGIRLAVVSNWSPSLPALLGKLGFAPDFESVIASALVRCEKPEPSIFRRALDELRVAPEDVIHVGDRIDNDVDGAEALGIRPLLVDRKGAHSAHPARIADLRGVLAAVGLPPTE